jgi:ribonuclease BN (tRNA processing enzyme)
MAALTLTILGASPAAPNDAGACSGYLLRKDGSAVLMDCGSGVAGRIAEYVPPRLLHGVAISHLHPDHYFDLVPLYYLIKFGEPRPASLGPKLALYVPPGGRAFFGKLGELIADRTAMLEDVFDLCEYRAGVEYSLGDLKFTFHQVQHYVLSHAMRVATSNGRTLVFSSDVAPCPQLVAAARDADLFMCESALLDRAQDEADPAKRGHMSAVEAGAAAQAAGARRLLITHYRSSDQHDAHHLSQARAAFKGPVELAREGHTYPIE